MTPSFTNTPSAFKHFIYMYNKCTVSVIWSNPRSTVTVVTTVILVLRLLLVTVVTYTSNSGDNSNTSTASIAWTSQLPRCPTLLAGEVHGSYKYLYPPRPPPPAAFPTKYGGSQMGKEAVGDDSTCQKFVLLTVLQLMQLRSMYV